MKRIIFLLLTVISFAAYGQTDDSTKYINYRYQYGSRMARYWADSSLRIPVIDTPSTGHKAGRIVQRPADKLMYIDNGTKWNQISGLVTDSILYRDSTFKGDGTPPTPLSFNAPIAIPYVYNVADYGILPDGIDHTAAFNSLLITVANAGGGMIVAKAGTYQFSGQWKFPYVTDNPTYPIQPYQRAIRIVGTGSDACGIVYYLNHGATTFNMTYNNPASAKIDTRGAGALEITNIAFTNTNAATDSTPFIHTTNTTLFVHHNSFAGAGPGYDQSISDAIILGGTSAIVDTTFNGGFQGYGTTIKENNFHKIRRGVYGRTFANGNVIESNTWWNDCGGDTNVAAVEILGQPDNASAGNAISNNLIELVSYKYGIKLRYATGTSMVGNNFWDRSGYNLWPIYLGTGAEFNMIQESFTSGMITSVYDSTSNNTILSSFAGGTTKLPNNLEVGTNLVKKGSEGVKVTDDYGNYHLWQTLGSSSSGGAATMSLEYKPFGASQETLWRLYRPATAGNVHVFGDQATSYVKLQSSVGNFHLNAAAGKTLFMGKENEEPMYIGSSDSLVSVRYKPIFYNSVPHGLIAGEFVPPYSMVDSLSTAKFANGFLSGAGINITGTTTKTVTNTLVTGLAGGQGISGGVNAGENLNIGSTAHSNKGSIFFGSGSTLMHFKEVNGWLGIGTSPFSALDVKTPYVSGQTIAHIKADTGTGFAYTLYQDGSRDSGIVSGISNLSTAATADASIKLLVKNGSSGDPFITYSNGVTDYSAGLDNSDNDYYKLSPSPSPSAATTGIRMASNGHLYYIHNPEFNTTTDTMAIPKWGQVLRKISTLIATQPVVSTEVDGILTHQDYNRLFTRQSLSNPTGTITLDVTLGSQAGVTFTSTGGRTLAFSNLNTGGSAKLRILNTSGATITLTLPSNSRLIGTGSVTTITVPTGNSLISLNDYDGTNYVFGLATD